MFKRRKKDALPDIISIWNKNNAFPDINSKWNTNDAFPDIMTQLLQTPAPAQPRPPVKTKSISSQICLYFFISGCSQINAREVVEGRNRRKYLFFMDWFLFFNLMTLIVKWIQLVSMKNSLFSGWNGNFEKKTNTTEFFWTYSKVHYYGFSQYLPAEMRSCIKMKADYELD